MKQNKETPTIAEMSEVVAKYRGLEYISSKDSIDSWGWWKKGKFKEGTANISHDFICISTHQLDYLNWNRLHEAWEKVSEFNVDYLSDCWDWSDKKSAIEKSAICHNKLETLTALYRAIIFINQLKENKLCKQNLV